MSKGSSGHFHYTTGDIATLVDLMGAAQAKVSKLITDTPDSKKKAAAIGAYDKRTGKTIAAFAGEIPKKIALELIKRADAIGGIGTHGLTERNTIGVCAEFHVVNSLLLSGSKWEDIHLTPAIRPRTGQVMPYCDNCKAMFRDLIN